MKRKILLGLILAVCVAVFSVSASDEHEASGTIKSIDVSNGTINISHGPIRALGMSAMSMDFVVADPAMLEDVKPGQLIDFVVTTDSRGRFVIIDLE